MDGDVSATTATPATAAAALMRELIVREASAIGADPDSVHVTAKVAYNADRDVQVIRYEIVADASG